MHLMRLSKSKLIDDIVVATTINNEDDKIANLVSDLGYSVYRGSEFDVLDRYYKAALASRADIVVRVTSDCPLIDPVLVDQILLNHLNSLNDFTCNIIKRTYPDGFDVEVITMAALKKAWQESKDALEREHVTHYVWKNSNLFNKELFNAGNVVVGEGLNFSSLRLTIDYIEDYQLLTELVKVHGINKSWRYYVNVLLEDPNLSSINKKYVK